MPLRQQLREFGKILEPLFVDKRTEAEKEAARQDYYKDLLRLIYRLLFLMVIEERDLVFPTKAKASRRDIYRHFYSVTRLRLLSEKRYLADKRKHDLWLSLLSTFRLFEAKGPGEKLGIAPLAGDLFGYSAIGYLSQCSLGNDVLLKCLRSLSLYEHPETHQLIRVNYGGLNVEGALRPPPSPIQFCCLGAAGFVSFYGKFLIFYHILAP